MPILSLSRNTVTSAALLLLASTAAAQAYTPPPPPLDAPCKPTKKDPCTVPPSTVPPAGSTMAFPFPGDTSGAVKIDPNASPDDPSNNPPPASSANQGAAGKYPFPGDAPANGSGAAPDASSNGSSSSGSSSSSSSAGGLDPSTAPDDEDVTPPTPSTRRRLPKVEDLGERESKDVEVSSFYFSTGDYKGAYSRGQDAVRLMPDDPEAHFALAQAASRLNKSDEARQEYKASLKLDLTEKRAKIAREQLEKLH